MATRERNGATATVGKRGPERQGQPRDVRNTPTGKFGQRLELLMVKAKLSTEEFAERIGVTPDAVRKYLRGDNIPNIERWVPPITSRQTGPCH
jgi:ribosome-binding protein aMBF1 (putative translation factor)